MKMWGISLFVGGFGRHMAVSPKERLFPYVVKTAAMQQQGETLNRHPAGVKGEGPPCQSKDRSVNRALRPSAS